MIALPALLIQAAAAIAATLPPAPSPDAWDALPALLYQRPADGTAELHRFVQDEVAAGRCAAATVDAAGTSTVRAPVIVLVDARGSVRSVIPGGIGCPTVEQFTAGVVARLATGNVRQPWPAAPRWFRAGLVYSWTGSAPR